MEEERKEWYNCCNGKYSIIHSVLRIDHFLWDAQCNNFRITLSVLHTSVLCMCSCGFM